MERTIKRRRLRRRESSSLNFHLYNYRRAGNNNETLELWYSHRGSRADGTKFCGRRLRARKRRDSALMNESLTIIAFPVLPLNTRTRARISREMSATFKTVGHRLLFPLSLSLTVGIFLLCQPVIVNCNWTNEFRPLFFLFFSPCSEIIVDYVALLLTRPFCRPYPPLGAPRNRLAAAQSH